MRKSGAVPTVVSSVSSWALRTAAEYWIAILGSSLCFRNQQQKAQPPQEALGLMKDWA
jgi:hypothetical protein